MVASALQVVGMWSPLGALLARGASGATHVLVSGPPTFGALLTPQSRHAADHTSVHLHFSRSSRPGT
jgi:hypothetical protein